MLLSLKDAQLLQKLKRVCFWIEPCYSYNIATGFYCTEMNGLLAFTCSDVYFPFGNILLEG